MDKQALQVIKDVLDNNQQITIAVGKNPTIDEMGAALALYLSLNLENKSVSIASPTEPIVELSNLVGINKVKSTFGTDSGDLVVSFPYKEGEIEKVSYTLENGFLNIIVKAGQDGLSFSEREVQYKREGGRVSVLFIIGTSRLSDLGNLFNPELLKETTIINIDNKSDNQGFGEIVLVSPNNSSVSEMVAGLLSQLNLKIDTDTAQNLLSGISFATRDFQSPETSSLAFEMVGLLMKQGAVRSGKQQTKPVASGFDDFSDLGDYNNDFDEGSFDDQFASLPKPKLNFGLKPVRSQFKPQQRHPNQPGNQIGKKDEAPTDWLTPKIYKGSSNV